MYKKVHGEKSDASYESGEMWTSTVLSELPCFLRCWRNLNHKAPKAMVGITVLIAVNMDSSDKHPLLIIRKSRNPRCFRGVHQLPTPYTNN